MFNQSRLLKICHSDTKLRRYRHSILSSQFTIHWSPFPSNYNNNRIPDDDDDDDMQSTSLFHAQVNSSLHLSLGGAPSISLSLHDDCVILHYCDGWFLLQSNAFSVCSPVQTRSYAVLVVRKCK